MFRDSCSSSLLNGYDEPETLRCSNHQICPTGADVRHSQCRLLERSIPGQRPSREPRDRPKTSHLGKHLSPLYSPRRAYTVLQPEPPRVYRRAKLSENCPLWNRIERRPQSRIHLSSARAVRLVAEHHDEYRSDAAAHAAIASKLGCSPDSLREWVRQAQRDGGERPGPTSAEK